VRVGAVEVSRSGTRLEVAAGPWRGVVETPLLGAQVATSVLAALAVGLRFGIEPDVAVAALAAARPLPGRLRPLAGREGSLLVDDTYNAAPRSVLAGLEALAALGGAPAIAVLGDMAELGGEGERWHRAVGERAAATADVLVTYGRHAAWTADAAVGAGMDPDRVVVTFTHEDAADAARSHLGPGAAVLVKGSAAARMERVAALLLDPAVDPAEVLVRQDRAWRTTGVVSTERPTWLEVDLGAVAHNVRRLAARAGGAEVMVVLKADAYGHGAVQVAHTALRHGATRLGVACVPEARALREAGIRAPILVLGYTPAWQAREALSLGLTLAVFDRETARAYATAARALDRTADVHVKVDTGMHRLGVAAAEAAGFVRALAGLDGLAVSGLFTHFACADDPSPDGTAATDAQLAAFRAVVADLEATGDRPPTVHAANSAGLLVRTDAAFDLVRPGIAVYGLPPGPGVAVDDLQPVLTWRSPVAQVHDLAAGEGVGYGHTWRAGRPSRVATVPVGYADGLRRAPATWRHVLVRGARAPLAGRVSMDQISIDVTDIPGVRRGDEVVLIGRQDADEVPATLVAEWLGTSCYEVVSEILARVPRLS
jgi:alanine racemase